MHNRLKQFLIAENVTQAQFAEKLKIGKANVSHVLSGRNKPGYDFITAMMAGFPHLNLNWLFFGTGKMYSSQQVNPPSAVSPAFTSELLFSELPDEPAMEIESTSSINSPDNTPHTIVKQRNVSKIVILYDDGTFQEL